jgi:hypothetical protein
MPVKKLFRTCLVAGLVFAGCFLLCKTQPSSAEKLASKGANSNEKAMNNPKFHKQLLAIAAEYQDYGKVDDLRRWAPTLCMAPPPPKARLSHSKDSTTHGKKLYFLFAKQRDAYMKNETDSAGQVIVKEAWIPQLADSIKAAPDVKNSRQTAPEGPQSMFEPKGLGPKSDLYIMYNTGSKTPDTDEGWIYGTVTPDGRTVTSAGRVESCMSCHISAPHGRLFGLKSPAD